MLPLSYHQAHAHRQGGACAVAADTDALHIDAQFPGVVVSPGESRIAVLEERGKRMLRCQPVQRKHHLTAHFLGIAHGIAVVIPGSFQHKTAAVEIDQAGCFFADVFRRQQEAGDHPTIVAGNLMGGHIQFLVPPERLRRLHVGNRHCQKLLTDGRRKEIPGEELPTDWIFFHRLCSFGL